ncbi:bifunctional phosphopantothenoylcysteine decarboxylase/phosphopantothenate synthase [Novosphingopyxis sp.]|uniref:bifunctional phosphopantothenoylcysteine decarboxylase/phosphopantothenate synthase n=1 Tax=Novosphingopyxis sp. TaxID=2709690 RepID=UPI003B5B477A
MTTRSILLIVGGGIAAYKSLELVRLLRRQGIAVRGLMTKTAHEFVTPLSLGVMTEDQVYSDMFDLKDEREIGHIQLSRQTDLIVVCPATADLLAKMAAGICDDLATTVLLATDKPVLAVPAMNVRMWQHPATRRNVARLREDGVKVMEPDEGEMACGEYGPGRLPELERISSAIERALKSPSPPGEGLGVGPSTELATPAQPGNSPTPSPSREREGSSPLSDQPAFAPDAHRPLHGKRILVTAGPTREPIDPVRYIANRSSGRQGFAIAEAAAAMGAEVTLVAGPVSLHTPPGVIRIDVETAREMQMAVESALPADAAILVAAVADWRAAEENDRKIKKSGTGPAPLALAENPDILAGLAASDRRPSLLVGFAAETNDVVEHAKAKLEAKGCDWIIANDVSGPRGQSVMGGDSNAVHLVTADGVEYWESAPKSVVAQRLMERIADVLDAD